MNRILNFALSAVLLLTLVGCSDDDEQTPLFDGIDNYISSFTLTLQDGSTVEASITGNHIEVTVSDDVVLSGASASYKLCEQAILYPDPATVSDWDNEHLFRVMAYNETLRDYTYTVVRTDIHASTVTLRTQADVEVLAASQCAVIDGSLLIGVTAADDDPVRDLSSLTKLREVRYNIIVGSNYAGEQLTLPTLQSAGGLILGTTSTVLSTSQTLAVNCPELQNLGQLTLCSTTVDTLSLPQLKTIDNATLDGANLSTLDLSALEQCNNDLTIQTGTNSATGNKVLSAVELPQLQQVGGSLTLRYLTAVENIDLQALQHVGGDCTIGYLLSAKTLLLLNLTEIGGSFSVNYLTQMTTFRAPLLQRVGGGFTLSDSSSTAMLALVELTSLEQVGGNFTLNGKCSSDSLSLPALTTINGKFELRYYLIEQLDVPKLSSCSQIYLYYLTQLSSIDLSKLSTIPTLDIIACYILSSVTVQQGALVDVNLNAGSKVCADVVFPGTDRIDGTLTVSNYTQNETLTLAGLKYIGTYSQTNGRTTGQSLSFPDLERMDVLKVSGSWFAGLDAPKLQSVSTWNVSFLSKVTSSSQLSMPALREIGTLTLSGGSSYNAKSMVLTELNAFADVTSIQSVNITYMGSLADYSGLKTAFPTIEKANWNVANNKYNPTWEDMQAGNYVAAE
jgi:hypothetical protein